MGGAVVAWRVGGSDTTLDTLYTERPGVRGVTRRIHRESSNANARTPGWSLSVFVRVGFFRLVV